MSPTLLNDFNKSLETLSNLDDDGDVDVVMSVSYALRNVDRDEQRAIEWLERSAARHAHDNEELAQEAFVQMIKMNRIDKARQV